MITNNLKFCREDLELTQKELGYIFGVSEYTISGWENCHDIIPLKKLVKFCNMYNFSVDFVTGLNRKNTEYKNKITLDKVKIGIKLKQLRNKLGYSQQQMANTCSISQTAYSKYERGLNLITTTTLYIICKNNKISMDSFLR